MMVKGKVGPGGRRARPQTEPFAQRRGRARRQNHLLMEMVADRAVMLASSPVRSRSPRSIGVSFYCRKSVNDATKRALFQKANEACVSSIFPCSHGFSIVTRKSYFHGSMQVYFRRKVCSIRSIDRNVLCTLIELR